MYCNSVRLIKLCLFVGLFLMVQSSIFSQDLLVKIQGDTIPVKVIEIQESFLVYHKTDLDEERVFTTRRDKLDKIIYANGKEFIFRDEVFVSDEVTIKKKKKEMKVKELNNQFLRVGNGFFGPSVRRYGRSLNPSQVRELYDVNDEALHLYNTGRSYTIIGNVLGFPFGYILGSQLANYFSSNRRVKESLFVASVMGSFVSIIFSVKGLRNIKKSTKVYNQHLQMREEKKLGFQSTQNGIGLVLSF